MILTILRGEPESTIYTKAWSAARGRARGTRRRRVFLDRMLDDLELAWQHTRPIQRLIEKAQDPAADSCLGSALQLFLLFQVTDAVRYCAFACAEYVPGGNPVSTWDEIWGEFRLLTANLWVLDSAVRSGMLPQPWQRVLQREVGALLRWALSFERILVTAERRLGERRKTHSAGRKRAITPVMGES